MKNILIIGATSAIAERCARIWAVRGDALYLVGRDEKRMRVIASDLAIRGALRVSAYCTDLNDLERHNELIESAERFMGGIDIVLIAHGTLADQQACQKSVEQTLFEIQTNALSVVSLLTLIADKFEIKKDGVICVLSSVAGDRGRASNYVYGAAKAMVTAFASGLRQRLHKFNVAVVTIKPGFVDTPMTGNFKKGFMWAKPHSVASQIVTSIDLKKTEVYVPFFWGVLMQCICVIPHMIFKKLNL